jgi:hypothetical protein
LFPSWLARKLLLNIWNEADRKQTGSGKLRGRMALIKIIEDLLRKAQKPMRVDDIASKMIESGLWETKGKTPAETVGARVYSDIKARGEASVFVKVSPKVFALREFASVHPGGIAKPAPIG